MVQVRQVPAHLEREDRHRQRRANPEAPRHVAQLGTLALLGRRQHRLQRHAADGAVARTHLAHLRVHRAGVLDLALVALGPRPCRCRRMSVVAVVVVRVRRVVVVVMMGVALHGRSLRHHVDARGRVVLVRTVAGVLVARRRHGVLLILFLEFEP